MRKQDDGAAKDSHLAGTDQDPEKHTVPSARVQQPSQQRHDGKLGDGEGQDAGREAEEGPFDHLLLFIERQDVEVFAEPVVYRGYGHADADPCARLL